MSSTAYSKNMSSNGCSSRATSTQSSGYDSDASVSSFSADFDEIGARRNQDQGAEQEAQTTTKVDMIDVKDKRIYKEDVNGYKGVCAIVRFGVLFTGDDDYEIEWNNTLTLHRLSWSDNCNLEGQEGIVSNDGVNGWAGWDDNEKCYLRYDKGIYEHDGCMKIEKIERFISQDDDVAHCSYVFTKGKSKGTSCTRKSVDDSSMCVKHSSKKNTGSDSETKSDGEKADICSYVFTKGKSKGESCTKESVGDSSMCVKHSSRKNSGSYSEAKSDGEKADTCSYVFTKGKSKGESCAKESVGDSSMCVKHSSRKNSGSDSEAKSDSEKADICSYVFTKGKSKGESCTKESVGDSSMCVKHSSRKNSGSDSSGEVENKKIEKIKQQPEESSIMSSMAESKNMLMTSVTDKIVELFSTGFKEKYASKAQEIIESEEFQKILSDFGEQVKNTDKTKKKSSNASVKKRKNKSKPKDKEAPKKAVTSFLHFSAHKRSIASEENPPRKLGAKELGAMWKELTDSEKKPYAEQAEEDAKRYSEEMKDYTPSTEFNQKLSDWETSCSDDSDDEKKSHRKTKTKKKKTTGPKKPVNCFIHFTNVKKPEIIASNPELKTTEISSFLGKLWREKYKDQEAGNEFIEMAKNDKARYNKEMENWSDGGEDIACAPSAKKSSKKKSSKKKSSKKKSVDEKSADDTSDEKSDNGYDEFCETERATLYAKNPDMDETKIVKKIEKAWNKMNKT